MSAAGGDGPDVRVCAVGDSFVAGVGDPEHLGWFGRLAAGAHAAGRPSTTYPLGVRRDTSADVLARWRAECVARLPAGVRGGVVVSFGVNDTTAVPTAAGVRVPPARSAANLDALLREADGLGWAVLVAGPPAVAEEAHNDRTAVLDAAFAQVCATHGVPYAAVLDALRVDPVWRAEVAADDGAHPRAAGYARLAGLLAPAWTAFLDRLGG
ncbi:GDSL-type esterase/lipase family protein [Kineococcus gynurae]|uniref:GDSL-type esterase/lipase family protein n=1 Tax=Kineococcus gynurae TaxID=452979 RepID=A0ABV5LQS1_9ACTN